MSGKSILGITTEPSIPGAPSLGDNAFLRHLFRTVEQQRNLALSALAELKGHYETLKEQYEAHVQKLTAEAAQANDKVANLTGEVVALKARVKELGGDTEPLPDKGVKQSRPKRKKLDKS